MGVVNVTPDSFSDGGQFLDPQAAIQHGLQLVEEGADILDLGAESTRPGHQPVPAKEQLHRLLPVLKGLRQRVELPISIDTTRAAVAGPCLDEGADWINDTSALTADPELAPLLAQSHCQVVLMHQFVPPRPSMPEAVATPQIMDSLVQSLQQMLQTAIAAGIQRKRIWLDPGLGFGTLLDDNLHILAQIKRLQALGQPLLVGPSRKRFIGHLTGRPVEQRAFGTAASVAFLALLGVQVVRVHDVASMLDVVKVADGIRQATNSANQTGMS